MSIDTPFENALANVLPPSFQRVLSVPLSVGCSFIELASRFSDEPGTVALLSGGSHDSARWSILSLIHI